MRAEPPIVTAIGAAAGLPHFFVEVEGTNYPSYPYVLISDPEAYARELDPDIPRTENYESVVFVTVVDGTAGNVASSREKVRALLNPGGLSATLAGYRVKRIPGEVRGIQMDKDTPKDAYGFRPYFAVDAYRLVKEV